MKKNPAKIEMPKLPEWMKAYNMFSDLRTVTGPGTDGFYVETENKPINIYDFSIPESVGYETRAECLAAIKKMKNEPYLKLINTVQTLEETIASINAYNDKILAIKKAAQATLADAKIVLLVCVYYETGRRKSPLGKIGVPLSAASKRKTKRSIPLNFITEIIHVFSTIGMFLERARAETIRYNAEKGHAFSASPARGNETQRQKASDRVEEIIRDRDSGKSWKEIAIKHLERDRRKVTPAAISKYESKLKKAVSVHRKKIVTSVE